MKSMFCLLAVFLFSSLGYSQNKTDVPPGRTAAPQTTKFPQFQGSKPRVEMPKALKLAQKFIKKQKINTANYYLSRVNLIAFGAAGERQIVWYFRWVGVDGTIGDYIEIAVFMDKSVRRLPPMQ
jgi:hypothetical protein